MPAQMVQGMANGTWLESPFLAMSGGARHRPASPELPLGVGIEYQISAFRDFRRLYLRVPAS